MNYDIIGDVHGHADALEALLAELGYWNAGGAWRQPGRQALFVGDFIYRGPKQVETVDVVRRMVDAGSARAVMGNHEFNAIAWSAALRLPDDDCCAIHPPEALRAANRKTGIFMPDNQKPNSLPDRCASNSPPPDLYGNPTPLTLLSDKVACVDYSVAKDGKLVAYRWDGEPTLDESKLHWVRS